MKIARIFRHEDGLIYICDDSAPTLDARGEGFTTKAAALRAALEFGYTHAKGSGTYHANRLTDLRHPFQFQRVQRIKKEAAKWRLF